MGDHVLFLSFSVITEWFPRMEPTFKKQHTEAGKATAFQMKTLFILVNHSLPN